MPFPNPWFGNPWFLGLWIKNKLLTSEGDCYCWQILWRFSRIENTTQQQTMSDGRPALSNHGQIWSPVPTFWPGSHLCRIPYQQTARHPKQPFQRAMNAWTRTEALDHNPDYCRHEFAKSFCARRKIGIGTGRTSRMCCGEAPKSTKLCVSKILRFI